MLVFIIFAVTVIGPSITLPLIATCDLINFMFPVVCGGHSSDARGVVSCYFR